MAGGAVVPDGGGEREEALCDAGGDSFDGATAVQLEVELALRVADRFEQVLGRVRGAVAVGRSPQSHSAVGQVGVQFLGDVALSARMSSPGRSCSRARSASSTAISTWRSSILGVACRRGRAYRGGHRS